MQRLPERRRISRYEDTTDNDDNSIWGISQPDERPALFQAELELTQTPPPPASVPLDSDEIGHNETLQGNWFASAFAYSSRANSIRHAAPGRVNTVQLEGNQIPSSPVDEFDAYLSMNTSPALQDFYRRIRDDSKIRLSAALLIVKARVMPFEFFPSIIEHQLTSTPLALGPALARAKEVIASDFDSTLCCFAADYFEVNKPPWWHFRFLLDSPSRDSRATEASLTLIRLFIAFLGFSNYDGHKRLAVLRTLGWTTFTSISHPLRSKNRRSQGYYPYFGGPDADLDNFKDSYFDTLIWLSSLPDYSRFAIYFYPNYHQLPRAESATLSWERSATSSFVQPIILFQNSATLNYFRTILASNNPKDSAFGYLSVPQSQIVILKCFVRMIVEDMDAVLRRARMINARLRQQSRMKPRRSLYLYSTIIKDYLQLAVRSVQDATAFIDQFSPLSQPPLDIDNHEPQIPRQDFVITRFGDNTAMRDTDQVDYAAMQGPDQDASTAQPRLGLTTPVLSIPSWDETKRATRKDLARLRREFERCIVSLQETQDTMQVSYSLKSGQFSVVFALFGFVYVPLSFASSYFGMNLSEINGPGSNYNVGDFWKVAGGLAAVSLVLFIAISFFDVSVITNRRLPGSPILVCRILLLGAAFMCVLFANTAYKWLYLSFAGLSLIEAVEYAFRATTISLGWRLLYTSCCVLLLAVTAFLIFWAYDTLWEDSPSSIRVQGLNLLPMYVGLLLFSYYIARRRKRAMSKANLATARQ